MLVDVLRFLFLSSNIYIELIFKFVNVTVEDNNSNFLERKDNSINQTSERKKREKKQQTD